MRLYKKDLKQDILNALHRANPTKYKESMQSLEQIAKLSQALSATEALQQEVEQMQTVDFDRYAKIYVNTSGGILLQQKPL